jgi:phosphoribosylformylglycinamidine (FGAM) synthase-like enzyme
VGIVDDLAKCVTIDFKKEGSSILLVGETEKELGGSEYYDLGDAFSSAVPSVDVNVLKRSMSGILSAIDDGLLLSCHDISHGGLAVALAEMCLGGNLGADLDLSGINDLRFDYKLFSESNTRWLVEVERGNEERVPSKFDDIAVNKIGKVSGDSIAFKDNGREVKLSLSDVREAWTNTLYDLLGGGT